MSLKDGKKEGSSDLQTAAIIAHADRRNYVEAERGTNEQTSKPSIRVTVQYHCCVLGCVRRSDTRPLSWPEESIVRETYQQSSITGV